MDQLPPAGPADELHGQEGVTARLVAEVVDRHDVRVLERARELGLPQKAQLRHVAGPERIARNGPVMDGVAAITLVIFVIPLFDGAGAALLANPMRGLVLLALGAAVMFAPHLLARATGLPGPVAGAGAMVWGTRSVALYAAALPFDQDFMIYVALYQFPMLATPLLLDRWRHGA